MAVSDYVTEREKNLAAYKAKYANMTHAQAVQQLVDAEPELKKKGYSVNLTKFLEERNIKPQDIKNDSSWMRPVKQTELREYYKSITNPAKDDFIFQDAQQAAIIKETLKEKPRSKSSFLANLPARPASTTKQNDVLPPVVEQQKPETVGRIQYTVPEILYSTKTTVPNDNSKYLIIIGIAIISLLAILFIVRRKK